MVKTADTRSPGARAFDEWLLELPSGGASRLAAALGVTRQAITAWRGGVPPSEVHRDVIESLSRGRVERRAWWTAEQRQRWEEGKERGNAVLDELE